MPECTMVKSPPSVRTRDPLLRATGRVVDFYLGQKIFRTRILWDSTNDAYEGGGTGVRMVAAMMFEDVASSRVGFC